MHQWNVTGCEQKWQKKMMRTKQSLSHIALNEFLWFSDTGQEEGSYIKKQLWIPSIFEPNIVGETGWMEG